MRAKPEKNIDEIVFFLFLFGYILEFLFRRGFLNTDFKFLSVLPFTVNIILLCIILFKKNDLASEDIKKKRKKYIFGLIFNLGFILFIFLVWMKMF